MLANWNFNDEAANSTTPQINRQKSARNLAIVEFDPSVPRCVFLDAKRGTRNTATLTQCDCKDFSLVGSTPRKTFKPCMHIYRLAIELHIIEAKYIDHNARQRLVGTLAREETQRLLRFPTDKTQWGGWASEIHHSGMQKTRQYRGYAISQGEDGAIRVMESGWFIHGYMVTLATCDCMHFREYKLPCKHIYAAALRSKVCLPFTFAEYEAAERNWKYVPLYLGGRGFTFAEYEAKGDKGLAIAFDFPEPPQLEHR